MVSIRKFKDWVTSNLTPDNPLYQIAARQKDELSLEEAIAQTEMVCALIDASFTPSRP
jgi:hypothetical protein